MNKNDRKIALGACLVAVLAFVALFLTGSNEQSGSDTRSSHSSHNSHYSHPSHYSYSDTPSRQPESFPFDPNTADSTQLLRLGLRPWQVRNIYKYRSKGGIYRTKEDFARLYGLTVKDYRRLEPYIQISSDYRPAAELVGERPRYERDTLLRPIKIDSTQHIVLNTADTNQLKKVPGIGSYYAKEIMRHGKWLGGYVSVDQLDEIDGFPSEAKKYFVVERPTPQRINVNRLTLQQLRRHPYINYYQAKTIVDYRRLHGDIHSLQDLRFSRDFSPEAIRQLEPYVE
ncbi:MAG: helix-hairpin-helix domain-containing protein, partial [Prevotella sp.]|nr:helix-hairpin-helix domain-containing protein [Prevotella sp.]